jgi:nicotinate-nucleotide adenylyltransferase
MKIALLGGSFDPPHLGHLLIARQVKELTAIDQVWLLPNYSTASHHKIFQKILSPVADRFAMAKLLENAFIKVSDFEMHHNKDSITIITLELLTKVYPQHTFYWITGSDKLETFQKYDRWEDILTNHNLIVFPREHMLTDLEARVRQSFQLQTIPRNVIVLHSKGLILTNISSTLIRERVTEGLSITDLVPKKVEEYITEKKIYQ